jgi:hypothetical protein
MISSDRRSCDPKVSVQHQVIPGARFSFPLERLPRPLPILKRRVFVLTVGVRKVRLHA